MVTVVSGAITKEDTCGTVPILTSNVMSSSNNVTDDVLVVVHHADLQKRAGVFEGACCCGMTIATQSMHTLYRYSSLRIVSNCKSFRVDYGMVQVQVQGGP